MNEETPLSEEFIKLFTQHQRRLYLYILSQVANPVEADEILQEANVVVIRKHTQFEPGTNFYAWACRIATYEVLKYRDRHRREKLLFSDDFVQQVAADAIENSEEMETRRNALAFCLEKLRRKDRELIQKRYAPGENGKSLAETLDRPANSVYQSLGRIRRTLLECIQRRVASAHGPS